jgi:hypothetical protein
MPTQTRKQAMAALMASFTVREKEAVQALMELRTAVAAPVAQAAPERPRRACAKYSGER